MKTIKIAFNSNDSVTIYLDNKVKLEITPEKNVDLNAKQIFDVFEYKVGYSYDVISEGITDRNSKWATPFFNLIKDIGDSISKLDTDDENTKDILIKEIKEENS